MRVYISFFFSLIRNSIVYDFILERLQVEVIGKSYAISLQSTLIFSSFFLFAFRIFVKMNLFDVFDYGF